MNAKEISVASIAIALICVLLFLFKGTANIFNAIFIPLVLYIALYRQKIKITIATYLAIFFICFLFFIQQILFVLFYCFISVILLSFRKKVSKKILGLIIVLVCFIGFLIAIKFTDSLFGLHIEKILMAMLKGKFLAYLVLVLIEGSVVGVSLILLCNLFEKKFAIMKYLD